MKYRAIFILLSAFCFSTQIHAQDSMMKMLEDSMMANTKATHVTATFKGTHIINTQSIETPAKGVLLFMIMHRFGKINDGGYQFFGLDNATMRMGFDYGITDRLTVGIGRSTFEKTYDVNIKAKLLRQTDGSEKMPVSVTAFAQLAYSTLKYSDKPYLNARYRASYATELLIARKINRNLSLQLSPAWLHYNLVPETIDKNDVFALGIGGRMKITKRASINLEYNYLPSGQVNSTKVYNSLSAGFDIETGGHVFQVHVTNSQGMIDPIFLGRTTGSWGKGDLYFGFNLSRSFNLVKKKQPTHL
jgi:opacity protein-like surface antigen